MTDHIVIVGGEVNGTSDVTVEIYDIKANRWNDIAPMSQPRVHTAAAFYRGQIYVSGGNQGTTYSTTNSVELYDMSSNQWRLITPMLQKRFGHGMVVLGKELCAIGGRDENDKPLSSVECYNSDLNSWKYINEMTEKRAFAAISMMDGKVYAFGGHNGLRMLDTIEEYDPFRGSWVSVGTMLTSTMAGAAATA